MTRRRMVLREENIATRQRMRKLAKRKDPKEVSVNILRNTSAIVKRGTTDGMKKAIGMVKSSGVKVLRKIAWNMERKEGGMATGADEFHKFFYDLQSSEMEEEEMGESLEVDSRRVIEVEGSVVERSVDTSGQIAGRMEIGEKAMRRQTWTNLSDVLMGQSHDSEDAVEGDIQGTNLQENNGLETIQEITEISPCGKLYSTLYTPQHQHPVNHTTTATANPFHFPTAPSRAVSISSFHSHASSLPSPAKLYPISPTSPNKSLRQLSSSTQDLFNISITAHPHSTTSDPIKPISPPHHPVQQDGEITREEDESVYSDILPPPAPVERSVSVLGRHDENDAPTIVPSRKLSTSTTWDAIPLTFESRTASSSRYVSTSGPNWIPTAPFSHTHDLPSFPPTDAEVVHRHVSSVVEPSNEKWKWAAPAEEPDARGKSVKERVRELDLVIDQAVGFKDVGGGKKVGGGGGGRKGMFGLWRS